MNKKTESGRLSLEQTPKSFFKILLVDDESSVRQLIRSILNSAGYSKLDEAESGDEALNKLAVAEYHLILLDKNLPGTSGLEVLKRARELQPNAEVIIITAYGSMESVIQAMDIGAFGYLTKPFSEIDIVIERVESALKRASNSHQINNLLIRLDRVLEHLGKSRTESSLPAVLERVDEALGRLASIVNELKRLSAQGKEPE